MDAIPNTDLENQAFTHLKWCNLFLVSSLNLGMAWTQSPLDGHKCLSFPQKSIQPSNSSEYSSLGMVPFKIVEHVFSQGVCLRSKSKLPTH